MRALVVTTPRTIALQNVPLQTRAGECLVRVSMAGICGTDLQILQGYAGFIGIPGHEFVGIVEAAPDEDAAWIGRRVVAEINIGCGLCEWCRNNEKEHCLSRSVVGIRGHDGAFAEFVTLPAANLHHVPDNVDDESAVFVEPLAAACRIFEQMAIAEGARVAVLGDGRLGLLVAQVIGTATPNVAVLGRHERKLALARSMGLTATLSDAPISPASRFDVVVEATGRSEGLRRALEIVRPRGTIVLKSTFHGEAPMQSWPIVVDEVTIVGSRCGPFKPAIGLLASGAVQVRPLISRVMTMEEHGEAFDEATRALKVLFRM
jgi:threonine dehydrogenase-like Zn-dependent dehydrogenase